MTGKGPHRPVKATPQPRPYHPPDEIKHRRALRRRIARLERARDLDGRARELALERGNTATAGAFAASVRRLDARIGVARQELDELNRGGQR